MKVDLFIPCFIDQFYPKTAFNVVKVLEKAGVEVAYNPNQTCCGQVAFKSGNIEDAKKLGEKFMNDFSNDCPIVAPTASCVSYVKNHFQELFYNTSNHLRFKKISANIFELSEFLVHQIQITNFGADFPHKVTYHDSCSALQGLGLSKEARQLLKNVKNLELVEMNETDICCGFGGIFSLKNEPISVALTQRKLENALETGAEYIVSTDLSCLMSIDGYIRKNELPIKVIHIADVLASGW